MIPLRETTEGVSFTVKVQPRASRTAITGTLGDALKVALAAPPVEGKANEALIRFFAESLDLPRSSIRILTGAESRTKIIRIRGISADWLQTRLKT